MLSIFGALLVMAGCIYFGYGAYDRLSARVRTVSGLISALEIMSSEIGRLSDIGTALIAAERAAGQAEVFFAACRESLASRGMPYFAQCWNDSLTRLEADGETGEILGSLGGVIGVYDATEQRAAIGYSIERLKAKLTEAEEEKKRSGKLYMTVSVSLGIVAVIVLI